MCVCVLRTDMVPIFPPHPLTPREHRHDWDEIVKRFLDCSPAGHRGTLLTKNGFGGLKRERSRLFWNLPIVRVDLLREDGVFKGGSDQLHGPCLVVSSLGPLTSTGPARDVPEKFLVILSDALPVVMIAQEFVSSEIIVPTPP